MIYFIAICVFEIFFFAILGMYFDQVWPSEIGVKKHPLFFLCCKLKANKIIDNIDDDNDDMDAEEKKK